jgi:hypothetical protein
MWTRLLSVVALVCAPAVAAAAPEALVGLTETHRIEPGEGGFIELATAHDGGTLVAYVIADAASKAELHVRDVSTGDEVRMIDLSPYTLAPRRLWFIGKGKDAPLLVIGPPDSESTDLRAWLFDPKSKKPPKVFGPGEAIVLAKRKGKSFVAVRTSKLDKKGAVVYTVTRYDLKKAKKIGKPKTLRLLGDRDEKLGFTFHHWMDDGMVAVGKKEGEWDKKEGIRMPDREARIDLVDPGTKLAMKTLEIKDLRAHARAWENIATEGGETSLRVRVKTDLTGVEASWDGETETELPIADWTLYEPKSLTWGVGDDGTLYLGISIDPWNRPAVNRKKADPEYFDIFKVVDKKPQRIGRILAPKARFAIGAVGGTVWVLERNVGFDRGAKSLVFYSPT